jgi:sigma-B regulation protein RsbU (phosphoserine phosphatase)
MLLTHNPSKTELSTSHHRFQTVKSAKPNVTNESEATPIMALKELVARLHREQNKIQNLLSSLGFALRSFNNLNQFLELTPLMAARVADAEGGALILFKSNGQVRLEQIHCQNGYGCQDMRRVLEKVTREISVNNSKQNLELKPQSFSDTIEDRVKAELDYKIQLFSTPILVKNIERGRLYIFSSNPEYDWTQTRKKLVQLVADQTAVAISNNELTDQLRQKERQDRELEIASEIQSHLLPSKCPRIKGLDIAAACKTANRIGGDYYDFIPTNYDKRGRERPLDSKKKGIAVPWSIVIGDVMGKGVPAGLIMTMTRGMLRAEILNRHSPARILEHLNRVMYADLENSHRFVTLFYSEYDPENNILSFSNAAHNPPLLWHAATKSIEKLETQGMLIGLDTDSKYEDAQIQLEPGDVIIYYTDGFTDAVNQHGERFDEENLCLAFEWACQYCKSSQEILDYLFGQVRQFIGSENGNGDDMTLVVMRVKSET